VCWRYSVVCHRDHRFCICDQEIANADRPTGAQISALQLSMYFYSLGLFALLCYLAPSIHKGTPLAALSFAYLYLLDSIINIAYTLLFAVSWFIVLAAKHPVSPAVVASAGSTTDKTSGFTSPALNVSAVNVAVAPADALMGGQNAVAAGTPAETTASGFGVGMLQPESATSILLIAVFWTVRLYFVVVLFAWARHVVRSSATPSEEPFEGRNNGEGWQGRLGRALIGVGKGYWQGDGWAPFGGNKFRRSTEPSDGRRFRRDRITVEV